MLVWTEGPQNSGPTTEYRGQSHRDPRFNAYDRIRPGERAEEAQRDSLVRMMRNKPGFPIR